MKSQNSDNFDVITKKIENFYFTGYMTGNIIEQKYAYMQLSGYAACLHDLGLTTLSDVALTRIAELDDFYLTQGRPVSKDTL